MMDKPDVLIVGAGPAGLSAARVLSRLGVERVVVVEREPRPGGIPLFCSHATFGITDYLRPMSGPAYAGRLAAAVDPQKIFCSSTVTSISPSLEVEVSTPSGMRQLRPRRILLATGIREAPRSARWVSGDRPQNVLTTGALQRLAADSRVLPFRRPVIVGSELVSFSALLTLRHAGAHPVAVIEQNPRITAHRPADVLTRVFLGTPVLTNTRLVSIDAAHDNAAVLSAVIVEAADGTRRRIECDAVVFTGGFVPEASLLADWPAGTLAAGSRGPMVDQQWRLANLHVYAAGNVLRSVETATWSAREGAAAAEEIAADLALQPEKPHRLVPVDCFGPVASCVPGAIAVPGPVPGPLQMRVRMKCPARGRFTIALDGTIIWRSRAMTALPERRIGLTRALPSLRDVSRIAIGFEEEDGR